MSKNLKAFLQGYGNIVKAKSDLDRLKFMPQKVEAGEVFDFTGKSCFGKLEGVTDTVIIEAARVNDASRCTSALLRDYFTGLDKFTSSLDGDDTTTEDTTSNLLEAELLDIVVKGDRKAARKVLKELKEQWFALPEDEVEDAIYDLQDCVADKDVDGAKEILADLGGDGEKGVTFEEPPTIHSDKDLEESTEPVNEDEADLLADIEDAIKDEDVEDVELLLKDLGSKHPRYEEFEKRLAELESKPADGSVDENNGDELTEEEEIKEICLDLDDAIEDKDATKQKDFLEELKEVAGEDSEEFKKYDALVNPKTETRRSRRGRK